MSQFLPCTCTIKLAVHRHTGYVKALSFQTYSILKAVEYPKIWLPNLSALAVPNPFQFIIHSKRIILNISNTDLQ